MDCPERNLKEGTELKIPVEGSIVNFIYKDFVKISGENFETSKSTLYFKVESKDNKQHSFFINDKVLTLSLQLTNYLMSAYDGIYLEDYLIKKGILPEKKFIDFNNYPSLTEEQLIEYEPELQKLKQEIEEEEIEREKIKRIIHRTSNVISFQDEKEKRCKKEWT